MVSEEWSKESPCFLQRSFQLSGITFLRIKTYNDTISNAASLDASFKTKRHIKLHIRRMQFSTPSTPSTTEHELLESLSCQTWKDDLSACSFIQAELLDREPGLVYSKIKDLMLFVKVIKRNYIERRDATSFLATSWLHSQCYIELHFLNAPRNWVWFTTKELHRMISLYTRSRWNQTDAKKNKYGQVLG